MDDRLNRLRQAGPRIEARYISLGMSQREFCAKAGISDTFLRPLIRGASSSVPRPAKMAAISTALGLPSDSLQRWVEDAVEWPLVDPPSAAPSGPAISERDAMLAQGKADLEALPMDKLAMALGYLDALQDPSLRTTNGG